MHLSGTDGHEGMTPSEEWSSPLLFSGLLEVCFCNTKNSLLPGRLIFVDTSFTLANVQDNSFQGSQNTQAVLPRTGLFRTVEVGQEQRRRTLLLLAEPVSQVCLIACLSEPSIPLQ